MSKKQNRFYKIKAITQTFIFLIELGIFMVLILTMYSKLEHSSYFYWINEIKTFEFLGKVTIIFAFYQLFVYSFIRLRLSARQDIILTIYTLLKSAIHLVEFNQKLDPVLKRCNLLSEDKGYMINADDYEMILKIKELTIRLESKKITKVDYMYYMGILKIDLEHHSEYNTLAWKNSILLNRFK